MKLSFIFELLLIFVLVAFAASAVIDSTSRRKNQRNSIKKNNGRVAIKRQTNSTTANRYCSCSAQMCNCCRNFNIPVIPMKGPGCAALQYLKGDRLAISMSFGDRVLTNTTIQSRRPQPICMPLPGGISKFCGRIYNIGREGDEFNACLALELRAINDIEAALRVSCFRFGAKGLRLEPPQPLPVIEDEEDDDDEDDDDDDDDDDDFDFDDTEDDDDDDDDEDDDSDSGSVDYGTFSVLDDDFIGEYFQGGNSGSTSSKKKKVTTTTTKAPVKRLTRKPVQPVRVTQKKPLRKATVKPLKANTTPKIKIVTSTTTMKPTMGTMQIIDLPDELNEIQPTNISFYSVSNESTMQMTSEDNKIETIAEAKPTSASMEEPNSTVMDTTSMPSDMEVNIELNKNTTKLEPVELSAMTETTTNAVITTKPTKKNKDKSDEDDDDDDDDDDSEESSEEEEDEDEDPISEVVGEVLDEDEEAESTEEPDKVNKNKVNKTEESKELLDDIVDGMAGTLAGDEDSDEKHDTNDVDESSRTLNKATRRIHKGSRESRDMWLERLHW